MGRLGEIWSRLTGRPPKKKITEEDIEAKAIKEQIDKLRAEAIIEKIRQSTEAIRGKSSKETQKKIVENKIEPVPLPVELPLKSTDEIRENIKKYPKRTTIEKGIDKSKHNVLRYTGILGQAPNIRGLYEKLFADQAKIRDNDILNIVIDNRDRLKHRISCLFTIMCDNQRSIRFEVTGILLEEADLIWEYLPEGQDIDWTDIRAYIESILQLYRENGAIGAEIRTLEQPKPLSKKRYRVTGINYEFSFV